MAFNWSPCTKRETFGTQLEVSRVQLTPSGTRLEMLLQIFLYMLYLRPNATFFEATSQPFFWAEFQENFPVLQMDLTQVGLVGHYIEMLTPVSGWLEMIFTAAPVSCGSESAMIYSLSTHVCLAPSSPQQLATGLVPGHRCTLICR